MGSPSTILDLAVPVDPSRDRIRGPREAAVTLVEYGDSECPFCGRAEPTVQELTVDSGLQYVSRHLLLTDVHPHAQRAAEAPRPPGAYDVATRSPRSSPHGLGRPAVPNHDPRAADGDLDQGTRRGVPRVTPARPA